MRVMINYFSLFVLFMYLYRLSVSFSLANLASGVQTAGPSSKGGADIQPLQVDGSVSFDDIGGLSGYIDALKEMVFFPLLYPDFFASYHITPPRGVLLCRTPGTGKTVIARALACVASKAGQKISFYMRKGADVLSKWVGEAERQLKMLFEEAQKNQPSIIFFDEIDGLAPIRSIKHEQIHNSIVSTLLALMDGLDSRGQVVLVGSSVGFSRGTFLMYYDRYQIDKPVMEDRSTFFDRLIEAVLSIPSEGASKKSQKASTIHELGKAPKIDTGPKISELKAKAEAEGHSLYRLRMCLRDVCNRVLYDKRFSAFHYPVLDEDAPNYHAVIQSPMDMSTLLQRVDSGKYITCKVYLEDFDLILANTKIYNRDDYNGARIVRCYISRAHELRDSVHGMLSQMDPALVASCEMIAENGGLLTLPEDISVSCFQNVPVVQAATTTRAIARLRHAQPEVNLDQSYEALKRPKKSADPSHTASTADEGSQQPQEPTVDDQNDANPTTSPPDCDEVASTANEVSESKSQDVTILDVESDGKIESAKKLLLERTSDYGVPQLERLYTRIVKGVFELKNEQDNFKPLVFDFLLKFAENKANF
ncbi:ATPase family AAA domain-containing protein At1g05910-like [Rutidosis leptorrhynchoides]|uniref:ATPase family AAA domain-containing protein At1g05910-like n=1 Tax=Rutidosis leptorrhynchoides TaxID=125765 RepID=UPI003A99D7FA